MGLGLTKEEFQKYSSNPQQDIERQNALNFIEAIYNDETSKMNAQPKPVASVPKNVNPNLSDEQKISALNFIETIYNDEVNKINGASQTTSNSTSTPSTSTLPVLKKPDDAPIKKEEKKPDLKLVSDAQKSREQAIADAVRINRVGESQNARQKAIDEAVKKEKDRHTVKATEEEVSTPIYNTDILGNDISVGTVEKATATPTPTSDIESGLNWVNEQAIKKKYKGASPENITTEDVAKGVEQGLKEGQAFTKQVYEDRAKETIGETLKKWSNPNYKLTKRDKETFRKKLDEADEKYGVANWWNYQGQQKIKKAIEDGKLTQEEANAYRDISIKLNPYLSYVSGVLSKTGGELASAVNVAGEKAINKIAGTNYTAAQETRNALNRELQNAQTQNGLATGIGQFVGMGAEYALANKMLSGIGGEGLKWNLLRGQMADTALQTAPMVANNLFDEKYKKEDGSFDVPQLVADIGKDEATNLLMNGAFEVAPKIINPIIEGKVADRLEKQIEKAYKTSDDVVRTNVEQDLKNTLSKADLQEILGREVADEEYLKYVNGKQTSETVENAIEDVAKVSDEVADATGSIVKASDEITDVAKENSFINKLNDAKLRARKFVSDAFANKGQTNEKHNHIKLFEAPEDVVEMVKKASEGNIDISGKSFAFEGSQLYHEIIRHSNPVTEASRGQIAISINDIDSIVDSMAHPDIIENISNGLKGEQRKVFALVKEDNGYIVLVEAVGGKNNPTIVPQEIIKCTQQKMQSILNGEKSIGDVIYENTGLVKRNVGDSLNDIKNRVTAAPNSDITIDKGTTSETGLRSPLENNVSDEFADVNTTNGVPTIETKAFSDTADEITPQNVIPERSIPVASSDRLQDMVDDIGEVRPKNARGFEETYVPQTNDVGRSKVVTNTYRKRNLAQWADEVDRRIATYNVEHETDTLNNAIKRVDKDGENWKILYMN